MFDALDFLAELTQHIPPKGTQLIRRYGLDSSRIKGRWEEMDHVAERAPQRWRTEHQRSADCDQTALGFTPLADSQEVDSTARKSAWARLLARVYEVDPFICPECGSPYEVQLRECETAAECTKSPLCMTYSHWMGGAMAAIDVLFEGAEAETGFTAEKAGGAKVVFKPSHRGECYLLPPSLDELIGNDNLVRFVDAVVDRLDLRELIERYKGGGASAYHPATLLKIWLFGWCRRVYTARPLAAALNRDVEFMWLSGEQRPSFVTLADFRRRLNGTIKDIFKEIVGLAIRAGMVRKEEIYIDHTKMEANSNRHRVVWRKSVEKYLGRAEAELDRLLELIDELNEEEENEADRQPHVDSLTPQMMDQLIERLNQRVKAGQKERTEATVQKRQLRRGKDRLEARERYLSTLERLEERNSMAKSDPESTAMMMKDGVTIRPGYNLGIASENGVVVGYDVSNNSNDSMSFKPVLDEAKSTLGTKPVRVCADAGYGSIENYVHLEDEGIDCYVKYPGWDRDLKGTRRPFEAESFTYDEDHDKWICPQGQPLPFVRTEKYTNKRTGYVDTRRRYEADETVCNACPVKDECTRGRVRSLHISPDGRRHRQAALANLASPMGVRMRSQRGVEVETPFGVQKHAYRFRRYHLRGIAGAEIESGLFLSAFNLRRLHAVFLRYMTTGARPALQIAAG